MYKNQLQELAQRSCFNLPAYSCIREGPDHAPRFKATVNFSRETFESPTFCSTLRQAEHAAAEVALSTLANRGPSKALAARVLDETGVYKNLLQETAHKAGLNLPVYTTVRSGPSHVPVFSCTVKLAGMSFTGNPARTKKQAQKNAALAAWSTLKRLSQHGSTVSTSSSSPFLESKCNDEQEQVVIARFLSSLQQSESKHFMQIDRQHGHQRFIPMCRGLTPPSSSLYPEQCQSWAYPSFSPELALCQVWQQEQLLQLQSHLLTLPVSPTPQLGPQILPYMQSIFHPSHPLCIPTRKQPLPVEGPRLTVATSSSSLCFSSKSVPEPIRSRSTVTIQEIKEEKTEKSSKFPPSVVPDASVSVSTNAESRIEQPIQEDANKNIVDLESKTSVKLESKFRNVQYGGSQSELASHRNLDSGFRLDNLCIQNPQSASNLRQQYHPRASSHRSSRPPSSAAAHTSMRTVGPISSVRPHPQNLASQMPAPPRMRTRVSSCSSVPSTERMNLRQVHPNFMAPAVRIRTVVPVCSAPPPRQMPSSIQEATVLNREKKDAVQEDASTAASELDNLHL